jgi:hypothetical protein
VQEEPEREPKTTLSKYEAEQERIERLKAKGPSKGALAAERASAGIGTDDRVPDDWQPLSRRD